jgi:hypothetical protein
MENVAMAMVMAGLYLGFFGEERNTMRKGRGLGLR